MLLPNKAGLTVGVVVVDTGAGGGGGSGTVTLVDDGRLNVAGLVVVLLFICSPGVEARVGLNSK